MEKNMKKNIHTHTGAKFLQLCAVLCDPMDHSQPGPSAHGVLQSSVLGWVAMLSSRGSSQPRDTCVRVLLNHFALYRKLI